MSRRADTALASYIIAFFIALGFFLSGDHKTALVIVVFAWAILTLWLMRSGGTR